MNTGIVISLALLLAPARCTQDAPTPLAVQPSPMPASTQRALTPLDVTNASESELMQHLGESVTIRGKFSMRGKVGPFILVHGRPIYLEPHGSFSWGNSYARMEGRTVRVTGTLRFAHYPTPPPQALPEGRAPDHFYFEAETAKVELVKRRRRGANSLVK